MTVEEHRHRYTGPALLRSDGSTGHRATVGATAKGRTRSRFVSMGHVREPSPQRYGVRVATYTSVLFIVLPARSLAR
jgi:hypothetical protein